MKKTNLLILILLILSIAILIISFIDKKRENNISKYVKNINFTNDSEILAIAYLNDISELKSKYNLESIKVYENDGEDKFLIIPRYKNLEVKIYEATLNKDKIEKGKLISTSNNPFVIICSRIENYSNIIFEFEYDNNKINYSPKFDLENGNLITNKYVIDITKINYD